MSEATFENLRLEFDLPLARLTVHRPAKLNALNAATLAELDAALDRLEAESALRAVILTGAGEKAFVAGADISEIAGLGAAAGGAFSRRGNDIFRRLETFPVPVIAAINGFALGGGLELAMACAIRIAADTAKMGQPEVKLGVPPGYGGTQRLPRLVGAGAALRLLLTGDPIDAQEALRLGLVEQVVPAAELTATATELARRIAANAPLAVRACLEAVRRGADMPLEAGLRFEAGLFALCCASDDMREGTRAFLEKRPPQFHGR